MSIGNEAWLWLLLVWLYYCFIIINVLLLSPARDYILTYMAGFETGANIRALNELLFILK